MPGPGNWSKKNQKNPEKRRETRALRRAKEEGKRLLREKNRTNGSRS